MNNPVQILKDLVRIDTTNPPGGEGALLCYLEGILEKSGLPFIRQETAPGRGNLLSWLKARPGAGKPPLFLISHADVVAADSSQWRYPPFSAHEDEAGYIHGRGTVDTKQLTVMELCAFAALAASGVPGDRDVYFLVTSDEESGSRYGLVSFLEGSFCLDGRTVSGKELFENSDVISEGGGFPVVSGEKVFFLCESGQKGCGAVEFTVKARRSKGPFFTSGDGMARAMGLVRDIGATELSGARLETVRNFEEKMAGAELSPVMANILTAMKHNTMTPTVVSGKNVNEVKVTCDVRLLPGFDRAYLQSVLDDLSRKWDCEYKILSFSTGYESDPETGFLRILEDATRKVWKGTDRDLQILPFVSMGSSDGRFLVDSHARVFGYSPVLPWDMTFDSAVTMVHGVNERIHRESVVFGTQVLTEALREAVREETRL